MANEGPKAVEASRDDMQDGIMRYYNEQAKLTDWYAEQKSLEDPFDFRDMMRPEKKPEAMG